MSNEVKTPRTPKTPKSARVSIVAEISVDEIDGLIKSLPFTDNVKGILKILNESRKELIERVNRLEEYINDLEEERAQEIEEDVNEVNMHRLANLVVQSPVHIEEASEDEKKAYDRVMVEWKDHIKQENERAYGVAPCNLQKYATSEKQAFEKIGWDDSKVNWVAYRERNRLYWIANLK